MIDMKVFIELSAGKQLQGFYFCVGFLTGWVCWNMGGAQDLPLIEVPEAITDCQLFSSLNKCKFQL